MSKFGFGMNEMMRGQNLHRIGKNTMLLKGEVRQSDLMYLKNWILTLKIDAIQDAVLIIDSQGGASDPSILVEMLQVPLHVHVAGKAHSFAGLLFMCGSSKTMSPDAELMLHQARWSESKEAEHVAHDEEVLFRHRFKVASIVSSVAPGRAKSEMVRAVTEDIDVYFTQEGLWETGTVDGIVDYTGEALGLYDDVALWYNKSYGKQGE